MTPHGEPTNSLDEWILKAQNEEAGSVAGQSWGSLGPGRPAHLDLGSGAGYSSAFSVMVHTRLS